MYGYIYRITDLTNGKCYIGQHKWNKPGIDLNYWGSGAIISNIVQKRKREGCMDTLLREKLMDCATLEELNYFEKHFIKALNTLDPFGYNIDEGGHSGLQHPNKTSWKKGHTPWNKGVKGVGNSFYGKKHSEEWKRKMSKKHTIYNISREELYELYIIQNKTQVELCEFYGCRPETIQRLVKKYKLYKPDKNKYIREETRAKQSAAKKGKHLPEETIQKMTKFHITAEELYNLYVVQGLSQSQIAKMYKCSPPTICLKLKKYNISKSGS